MGIGVGEALVCKGESRSTSNRYAVAMEKEGTFIGHLLEAVACVLLFVFENISCDKFSYPYTTTKKFCQQKFPDLL